jgi:hypothetical protein
MSSELMGVTKKAKVTFTCEPDLKDGLEEWAHSESRTLSNLIEMVIRQAYEIHQKRSNPSERIQTLPPSPANNPPTENTPPPATKAKRGKASKEAS